MTEEQSRRLLGARLKEARLYRGFSQEEVADYVGVPRPSISMVESGLRSVDSVELQKFAALFESSVSELLDEKPRDRGTTEGVAMLARAAAKLSDTDREEVLRFAQFLQARRRKKDNE